MTQEQVNAIVGIIVAAAFGGIVIGQTSLALALVFLIGKIANSPVLIEFLRHIAASLSPEWQQVLKDVVSVGDQIEAPDTTTTAATVTIGSPSTTGTQTDLTITPATTTSVG